MDTLDYGKVLRWLHELAPMATVDVVATLAQSLGATDAVAYLVDFEQTTLVPVPDRSAHLELPVGIPVAGTEAGRAFAERRLVSEAQDQGTRVWAPILEGTDCTGVLAVTVAGDLDDAAVRQCEELGMLAGVAIAVAARSTDLFNLVRRRRSMSLAASIQWDNLPPLRLAMPEAASVGVLEPAYDIGGDCFDHAANGYSLDVAIMDAMGHGLASSTLSSLAIGCYRHDRRERQPLAVMHQRLDDVLAERYQGEAFVTGQLAQLNVANGELQWLNAGHPRPFLVRRGTATPLECRPSLPWGLGGPLREVATETLDPGDGVVFYTDGVIEGRPDVGPAFGIDRFVHLLEQAGTSSQPPEAVVRQTIQEVVDFSEQRLRDDATIVWVTWHPPEG